MSRQDTTIKDWKFDELYCKYINNLLYLRNFNTLKNENKEKSTEDKTSD